LDKCTQRLPGTAEENVTNSFKVIGLWAEIWKWDFLHIEQECCSLAVAFAKSTAYLMTRIIKCNWQQLSNVFHVIDQFFCPVMLQITASMAVQSPLWYRWH